MAGQDVWLRSARQRQRRLLTTVLLACVLMLLAAFVAASRWELHRAPASVVSLGKRLVGIVVVTPGLEVIGPSRSLLRNLVRLVDSFPVYLIGFISIGLSGRRQRVGDRLAGAVVLRESALMVPRVGTVPGVSPAGDAEAEG